MNKEKEENKIALIYCRVSSERQKTEGHGLDSQEHRCREYATSRDLEVKNVFRDSFTGGGDFMQRPAMRELLGFIDAHPHQKFVVIFDDLKRFARDTVFHMKLRTAFRARDVELLCLNYNFDDTPEGEFVETIFAAQGQLERQQNKRQVIQKQKARLELGYWPFYPPPGYKQVKYAEHGKLLTVDDPKASIIREAFEGYDSGRFSEQLDVQKFLQDRDYLNGKRIYLHLVKRILTRVVYAGHVEYLDWEVERRKGKHEGIVSLDMFERVQLKLKGRAMVRTRRDFTEVFALRGFASCSVCRQPFTASESTGRSGVRHPYYRCRNRECSDSKKSIRKADLEGSFTSMLQKVKPSPKVIALAKAIVEDVRNKRKDESGKLLLQFDREMNATNSKIEALVGQISRTEKQSMVEIYECQIEELSNKMKVIKENRARATLGPVDVGTAFAVVVGYLNNPIDLWVNGTIDDKRRVLKLVFADNFTYDRVNCVGTAKLSVLYEVFEQFHVSKYQDVEVGRIELPSREEMMNDLHV